MVRIKIPKPNEEQQLFLDNLHLQGRSYYLSLEHPNEWVAYVDGGYVYAKTEDELRTKIGSKEVAVLHLGNPSKCLIKQATPKPQFDPDFSPRSMHNRDAANADGLRFDRRKRAYVDSEGALVRDKFGQPY